MTTETISTSKLDGAALDWAVAQCEGVDVDICLDSQRQIETTSCSSCYEPSKNWAQSGPIMEREGIELSPRYTDYGAIIGWTAMMYNDVRQALPMIAQRGDSLPVAAMRVYVQSKFGSTIDVPANFIKHPTQEE